MGRGEALQPEDFPPELLTKGEEQPAQAGELAMLAVPDYREARRQFEAAFIKAKLREHGGNITRTAAAIGLHRQSLQEKLRELGIQAEKA